VAGALIVGNSNERHIVLFGQFEWNISVTAGWNIIIIVKPVTTDRVVNRKKTTSTSTSKTETCWT
jgi:hypothetical protein